MIYLIYPHDRSRMQSAPWSIGHNLAAGLRKRGHMVECHDWTDQGWVWPDGPDDVLIGHPHPDPTTVFRSGLAGPWK